MITINDQARILDNKKYLQIQNIGMNMNRVKLVTLTDNI